MIRSRSGRRRSSRRGPLVYGKVSDLVLAISVTSIWGADLRRVWPRHGCIATPIPIGHPVLTSDPAQNFSTAATSDKGACPFRRLHSPPRIPALPVPSFSLPSSSTAYNLHTQRPTPCHVNILLSSPSSFASSDPCLSRRDTHDPRMGRLCSGKTTGVGRLIGGGRRVLVAVWDVPHSLRHIQAAALDWLISRSFDWERPRRRRDGRPKAHY